MDRIETMKGKMFDETNRIRIADEALSSKIEGLRNINMTGLQEAMSNLITIKDAVEKLEVMIKKHMDTINPDYNGTSHLEK